MEKRKATIHPEPVKRAPRKHRVKNCLDAFFRSSSIHGLGHLGKNENKHFAEYLVWILALSTAIIGMSYMGLKAWRRYRHFPTVISMEKDYRNWNTTFAMVTFCPEKRIDEVKLNSVAYRYNVRNTKDFLNFFGKLSTASYIDFEHLPHFEEVSPEDYVKILAEAKFDFTIKLTNTNDIAQVPILMVTEFGLCYGVNTELGIYFAVENWYRRVQVRRGSEELIMGNPLDGEVFVQAMSANSACNVTLISPFDVPDVCVRQSVTRSMFFLLIDLAVLPIISSDAIRSLTPEQRRCRFFDESDLEVSYVYSYNLCRIQCRADLAYKLCQCIPYFYRKSETKPYCNVSGMWCLGRHRHHLMDLRDPDTMEKFPCNCLPLCNDVNYLIRHAVHIPWPEYIHMKYSMVHFPRTRLKRDVIFGFADFLVSIGGSAGLLLGCSVISFVEIVHFVVSRLIVFVWKEIRRSKGVRERMFRH